MKIRDVMTWNVVSVSSDTPIMEARRIMEAHNVRRLPVVDRGKLVGIVNKERIMRAGPSSATSLSVWEINYLMAKMQVKEIMVKDVVTVSPDMSVESAVALAQSKGAGALPVLEDHSLVGIVTTNDFFYKIVNPILGIGKSGVRLIISNGAQAKGLQEVADCVKKQGYKMVAIHNMPPLEGREFDLYVQLDTDDASQLIKDLTDRGYPTEIVDR